jgi:death on curing protein
VTDFLTVADVLAIHDDLIERYGGSQGMRDPGLLEAALFRPQSGYYADILDQAAALWESLAQNHPFVDGNKRIAFAATFTFLDINGVTVIATAEATFDFIDGLYRKNAFRFDNLVDWLRSNTRRA